MTKRKRNTQSNSSGNAAAAATPQSEGSGSTPTPTPTQMMMNMSEADEARYLEEIRVSYNSSANEFTDNEAGREIFRQLIPTDFYINKHTRLPVRVVFVDAIELTPEQLAANRESGLCTMIDETHRCEIIVLGFKRIFSEAFTNGDSTLSAEPGVRYQLELFSLGFNDLERVEAWTPEQVREFTQFLEHPDVFIRPMGILPVIGELQSERLR